MLSEVSQISYLSKPWIRTRVHEWTKNTFTYWKATDRINESVSQIGPKCERERDRVDAIYWRIFIPLDMYRLPATKARNRWLNKASFARPLVLNIWERQGCYPIKSVQGRFAMTHPLTFPLLFTSEHAAGRWPSSISTYTNPVSIPGSILDDLVDCHEEVERLEGVRSHCTTQAPSDKASVAHYRQK